MKISSIGFLIFTTVILVLLSILAALNFPFSILFYLMCFGQIMLLVTVYKVLTDKYTSKKTFEDFYEDYSPNSEDRAHK